MAQYTIEMAGLSETAKRLGRNLAPAIEAGAMGIAAAIEDETAPYPPPVARRPGRGYYLRGRGGFTAKGIQISRSEMLNRRWLIRSMPMGARLRNTASYAGKVHGRNQAKIHGRHGWVKIADAIRIVIDRGVAHRLMMRAINKALQP